jgi:hypothetical protein
MGIIEFGALWQAESDSRMRPGFAHKTSCITLSYYVNLTQPKWLCYSETRDLSRIIRIKFGFVKMAL